MEITLRPDLERFVAERVKAGVYRTASEVISNALDAFKAQEELPSGHELNRLIAEGQAQADRGELLDGEEVFQDILARNSKRTRPR